ncbi:MAG: hypothetical protein WA738_00640 [Candidatus Angelobacter sp.]
MPEFAARLLLRSGELGKNFRALVLWLADLHAPLGRWSPLAASALFASSGIFHFAFVRGLAYSGAIVLVILIAADMARSFIDTQSYPDQSGKARAPMTLPMLAFRVALSMVLGSVYTTLVFIGIGFIGMKLWLAFLLLPLLFIICALIAWRNVDLWYEQGATFEEELCEQKREEAESRQHPQLPQVFDGRIP